jgi:hypothetical protein
MPGWGIPNATTGHPGWGALPRPGQTLELLGRTRTRLPVPEGFVRNTRGGIPRRFGSPVTTPLGEPTHLFSRRSSSASLPTFRINTSKSVSKQMTLSPIRINTCEKTGGRGCAQLNRFCPLIQMSYPRIDLALSSRWLSGKSSPEAFSFRFGHVGGIEEFDRCEGKVGLESGCWSTRRGRRSRHRSAGRTGRTLTKR